MISQTRFPSSTEPFPKNLLDTLRVFAHYFFQMYPIQSVTSGKAGGMYCEPLKAVFKPLDIAINEPFLISRNPGRVILGTPCRMT